MKSAKRMKSVAGDLQALGRAQDRDGGRDDTVTVEQRGAEEPEEHHERAWRLATGTPCALDQREKREDAALASIVEAHDEGDVLHADDEDQRPHDQREDAVHGGGRGGDPMAGGKHSRNAQSGLGPRSPKTTPRPATDSA